MGKVKAVPQFSESISSFCELMENAQRDYAWNYDEVNRMDRLTQATFTNWSLTVLITKSEPRLLHSLQSVAKHGASARIR